MEENEFLLNEETGAIIGIAIEIHRKLGFGFSEIVYKDALELDFAGSDIPYSRERQYKVEYKGVILKHYFVADFVVFDSVILEIKAKQGIVPDDIAKTMNYLKCSGCKVGLILNFGRNKLDIKRLVL